MKRIVYALTIILILDLLCGLPASLVAGIGSGQSATVTVTALPIFTTLSTTDVSDSVDANGVFTQEVTTESTDGICQLFIAEGITGLTKDGETLSELSTLAMETPPAPPEDSNIIGTVYELGPDGATFDPSISLTITYDESLIPAGVAEGDLVIAIWNAASGLWVELEGCVVDPATNTITGPVSHFSPFTILAYTGPPSPTPTPPPSDGGGGAPAPPPPPPGVRDISSLITVNGVFTHRLTIQAADKLAQLTIAKGTKGLTGNRFPLSEISIIPMEEPPYDPPQGAIIIGMVYDIGPDRATFDPPIFLTFSYNERLIPAGAAEADLVPVRWDEEAGEWVALEFWIVDSETNTITGLVRHFTPFTILAYIHAVSFATSDILVIPTEVNTGETVNIIILVTNTSGQPGIYEVVLNINDATEASSQVTIGAGDSALVSFSTAKDTAGTYSIEVNGLTGSFTVKEGEEAPPTVTPPTVTPPTPTPPITPTPFNWPVTGGIIVGLAAIAALAFTTVTVRKRLQGAPELAGGRFGKYMRTTLRVPVVERLLKPARISVINVFHLSALNIDPERVRPGEPVTIIAEVTCIARETSSCSVVLRIKGIVEAVKEITLRPRQSQKMAFTILKDKPGVYDVSLEDLTGSFVVEEISAPPPPPKPISYPAAINIQEVIGRFMAAVATATAGGIGFLIIGIREVIGRSMASVTTATAGGIGSLVSKREVITRLLASVATATAGGVGSLVSKREIIGRFMAAVATATAGGVGSLVSKREIIGRFMAAVATATAGGIGSLVSKREVIGRFMASVATATAGGIGSLVSKREVITRLLASVATTTAGGIGSLVSKREVIGRFMASVATATAGGVGSLVSKREVITRLLASVATTTAGGIGSLVSKREVIGRFMATVATATAGGIGSLVSKREVITRILASVATATAGGIGSLVSKREVIGRFMATVATATAGGIGSLVSKREVITRILASVATATAGGIGSLVSKREVISRILASAATAIAGGVGFLIGKREIITRLLASVATATAGGVGSLASKREIITRLLASVATATAGGIGSLVSKREVITRLLASVATATAGGAGFIVSKREVITRLLASVATATAGGIGSLVSKREVITRLLASVATTTAGGIGSLVSKREVITRLLASVATTTAGGVGSLVSKREIITRLLASVATAIIEWVRLLLSKWKSKKPR